ncbi:MAG: hypothetical protein LUD47_06890, partial [Clostridia bacterium]|nr:hypothetical protein [Clostridia bacterium]
MHATCETEGEEVYTYGNGKGVVVRVTTPKDHDWVSSTYTDGNGNELPCYKCGTCDRVVLSEGEENEYDSESALASDIETQEKFDDAKSGILGDLREEIDKLSFGKDSDAYKAVEETVEEVYEEYESLMESTDYEAKTGDDDDRETYLAELESVLNETLVDATQTSYEVSTEYMVDALYQELLESGKYDEAVISSLDDIFYELVSDLGKITVDGVDGMKDIYDAFYDRAQAALNGVSATTAFSTEDSDYSGSVESTEGMSSSVDLEIIEIDSASVVADMDSYVYVGDKDLTDGDIAGLVEGKGVAAVFEISLKDTASG